MTPLMNEEELAAARQECEEAHEAIDSAEGIERLRLIRKAFPFALTLGECEGHLTLAWSVKHAAIAVFDLGGFLTLILPDHSGDLSFLFDALRSESRTAGTLRYILTGQKPPPRRLRPSERPKAAEYKPKKPLDLITLADLGL